MCQVTEGARWPCGLERWFGLATGRFPAGLNRPVRIPVRKLCFGTLAIPFTPLCQCLSEETLKAVGPFYLVSMPGEVKDPTSPHYLVPVHADSTRPPRTLVGTWQWPRAAAGDSLVFIFP